MAAAARAQKPAARPEHQNSTSRAHRRHRKRRNATVVKTLLCTLAMVFTLGYIGVYAQVTRCGYSSADLAKKIRAAEMDNQALHADIQRLSSPGRLAAAAKSLGMVESTDNMFFRTREPETVAKAE